MSLETDKAPDRTACSTVRCSLCQRCLFAALVGVQVEFAVIAGGGSIVENQPATTDGNGLVSATWRMGTGGEQRVQARPYGLGGTPVEFVAQLHNSAPILQLPADTTIESGQLLAFTVLASDRTAMPSF